MNHVLYVLEKVLHGISSDTESIGAVAGSQGNGHIYTHYSTRKPLGEELTIELVKSKLVDDTSEKLYDEKS